MITFLMLHGGLRPGYDYLLSRKLSPIWREIQTSPLRAEIDRFLHEAEQLGFTARTRLATGSQVTARLLIQTRKPITGLTLDDLDEFAAACRRREQATGISHRPLTLEQIHESLRGISRERDVLDQGFDLATSWWRRELEKFGLEVQPPLGGSEESVRVDRRSLFGLASEVFNDKRDPRDFAFHVLLWGSGSSRRNNRGRIESLAKPAASTVLKAALEAARTNSDGAFDAFRSRGRNTFSYLGPAYFTKLMYFAGEGEPKHASLIVDRRVLTALGRTQIGEALTSAANYGRDTYLRACAVMQEIASSARDTGDAKLEDCTADMVERWAFDEGGRERE